MSSTVLIAPADRIPSLKARDDLGGAITFTDAEALRALDTITRQRPRVVVLDRLFATTSRGAALINRIKADPSLTGCEIRIVTGEDALGAPRRPADSSLTVGGGGAAPALAVAEAPQVHAAPLDQRGTRRAPRFRMADGLELQIDGNPASLVDLSVVGAQVVSPTILRPNQRVRVQLPDGPRSIRFSAAVAWASFEIPKGAVRYRAGVEFFEANASALTRFIDTHKK
ncbi:MAG: hypothetical protein A3F70_16500 [Acidobacteria bacterium RIFCSPLOWO2_12_FULL_67_14]|nr:MAG: hypothetical protein A3H29_19730 [Acidobacteria bacterium RIFCSPLOWO2_02_FULL_67_21]OFW40796.1 MAG: hypothetical protein A3F70_16500 [Acidobacteria bacterium RIFCSPLOWO2_12_FULL_67_14]